MNNNMIECPKCGNVQPSDSEKCFKCGFRLNSYLDYLEAINAEVNGSSGERIKTPYDEINKEKSDLRNKDTSKSLIHNPFFIVGILLIMISLGSLIMFAIDTDWFKNVPEEDRKNRIDEENYKKALQNIKEGFITVDDPLIIPKYYQIPIDLAYCKELAQKSGRRWVFPDEDHSAVMRRLREKRGKKGPLWEYLLG